MDPQKHQKAISFYERANTLYAAGKLRESEGFYRKAIKIKHDFAEAYGNLGNVFKDMGRIKEATGAYRKALNIYPNHPLLLNNMGNMYQLRGERKKAIEYFRKSIERDPNNPDAWNNLGNMLKEMDQFDESEDCYRKAIALQPESADAFNNLGSLLNCTGKHVKAVETYQQAIKIRPDFKEAYNNLGLALMDINKADEAVLAYKSALKLDRNNKEIYNNLGIAFQEQGKMDEAIDSFKRALEIYPDYIDAHVNLAVALRAKGKQNEALTNIEIALNIDSMNAKALATFSGINSFSYLDNRVRNMEKLFSRKSVPEQDKIHLGFALGKAFEELNDYDRAFQYIAEGNRLKRKYIEYSQQDSVIFFQELIDSYSSSFFSDHKNTGHNDETPIFILGMPRSGTSLVEQILSSHPLVHGAGELDIFPKLVSRQCSEFSHGSLSDCIACMNNETLAALGKDYIKDIRKYSDSATYITDKMPYNFIYIGLIRAALPNAKIIHCVRDPMDNCLSIYKNLFGRSNNYAYDQIELGEYYRLYKKLMNHLQQTIPADIYNISYEKLVDNQGKETRNLLDYCNLPWDEACLSFYKTRRTVSTLSAMQVRKAIYRDSILLWHKYEKHLDLLRKAIFH